MAEMTTSEHKTPTSGAKRKTIHMDMTPLVDLGFLLITFFMFAANFNKPNIMDLGLPAKGNLEKPVEMDYRNQLTFLLGKDDRVFYYQKEVNDLQAADLKETSLSALEISKLIKKYKAAAAIPDHFTVIIKPTEDASYKNFVDILDEMAISNNERYGITELKPQEKQLYLAVAN